MWMLFGRGDWSFWFIFCDRMTVSLWSTVPIGMISVFSMLNFAPKTEHYLSRVFCTVSRRLCLLR